LVSNFPQVLRIKNQVLCNRILIVYHLVLVCVQTVRIEALDGEQRDVVTNAFGK
jgi:hypothetical protein